MIENNYVNDGESLDCLKFQKKHIEKTYFINQLNWRCFVLIETLENINENYFQFVKSIFIIFNFTLKHCTNILKLNLI